MLLFLALTFALSWLPAWLLRDAWRAEGEPLVTRLFTASLVYAICMGWQPMLAAWFVMNRVDDTTDLDHGLRPAPRRFTVYAVSGAIGLAGLATALASIAGWLGAPVPETINGHAEPGLVGRAPSAYLALMVGLAFVGTLLLVWLQAFSEEIGWRGYLLIRLMQRLGPWRGLLFHGVIWGLWYAPIFIFANSGLARSALRASGFVVTCMLLGALLAWLRLAARSLVPVVVANATLTLVAGLPYVLHGLDAGLRSAVYGPIGWMLMALLSAVLASTRWRLAVRVPHAEPTAAHGVQLAWWVATHEARRTGRGRDRMPN
jgi:membrane protease YdiL (CAAX protease family)